MEAWPPAGMDDPMMDFGLHAEDGGLGDQNENWEDWLRWDPAAEPTSPEDGTMRSGSSKNDSPLQDAVLPMSTDILTKVGPGDETLAPPLVVGEDTLNFSGSVLDDQAQMPFFFSQYDGAAPMSLGFPSQTPAQIPLVPKIDTTSSLWTQIPVDYGQNVTLSAISNDQNQHRIPSAMSTSYPSPASTSQPRTSMSLTTSTANSPTHEKTAPKKRAGRKRKADVVKEEAMVKEDNEDNEGSLGEDGEPPVKKTSHNVIEKRYRNNLADKIVELRNAVPSLRAVKRANKGEAASEDLEGLTPAHKLNKATVMGKATEYIRHLEKRTKSMAEEMAALKARLAAVEASQGTSPDSHGSSSDGFRSRQPSSASQTFLNVPQESGRFMQQYSSQQSQPDYSHAPRPDAEAQNHTQAGNGGRVMNRVMMGAMASLMAMEGLSENQDDSRMLFALPTSLFKRGPSSPSLSDISNLSRSMTIPLLKLFLIIGTLVYLIQPLMSFSGRRKEKARPAIRLPAAPSLASPVEVRRKAWLTAVQTVYVPKHFLLEVVVVTAKMFMLSIRRLIGSEAYCSLMGTTKAGEAARTKAWDIAIDAQLAGGDAEVSYYRLLLTLMTSGTLPDSPVRLMQKAVHFRVFFWEMANAGYGNIIGFKHLTERVGEIYWESARKMQKELLAKSQGRFPQDESVELLPDHLASLIALPCEDVLVDEMIQRAWNLAWNKPSANGSKANAARDGVVEDHSIRSPLDAVAAWYSNMLLDNTFADILRTQPRTGDVEYFVNTAVSIAPRGSATQSRALAAKAVLSGMNKEDNILAALDALPAALPDSTAINLVSHQPASPDICTTLTLAKLISLLTHKGPSSARYRAHESLANLRIAPSSFTLLSAVAAYRLLEVASNHRLPRTALYGLEELAASLRIWIGTSTGVKAGLDQESCGKVVDLCLCVARKMGGWGDGDSGYGSVESSPSRSKRVSFSDTYVDDSSGEIRSIM